MCGNQADVGTPETRPVQPMDVLRGSAYGPVLERGLTSYDPEADASQTRAVPSAE